MTNTTSTPKQHPIGLQILDLILCVGMSLFSIAIGSVVGHLLIGQFIRLMGWMLQLSWLSENGLNAGWLIGAGLGLAAAISRMISQTHKRTARVLSKTVCGLESIDEKVNEQAIASDQESSRDKTTVGFSATDDKDTLSGNKSNSQLKKYGSWKNRRAPSFRQFFFATGFLAFVGVFTGAMIGLTLCLILISVTTSPFVPNSWRPKIEPIEKTRETSFDHSDSNHNGGTSFQHPFIAPIMIWSIVGMTSVGLVTGGFLSFFPEEKEKAGSGEACRPAE